MPVNVLLILHHSLDANSGAPGVTLALGNALASAGCTVEYFSFDQAFAGEPGGSEIRRMLRFPWRVAAFLKRRAGAFDVVDAATGDAWIWAVRGRPGAKARHALVTRSHGLEHAVDNALREDARRNGTRLSWKYPFYHGGYRLWEVAQSLRRADRCILLNEDDRSMAVRQLGVPQERAVVLPLGVADGFHHLPPPQMAEGPLLLTFVGTWLPRKGIRALTAASLRLLEAGLDFRLLLLGTGQDAPSVLASFPDAVRPCVQVVPHYRNTDLPSLLIGRELFLMPSLSEGFGVALIEAMACGLTPIASTVVGAASVITPGENGGVVPVDDADALAERVLTMAADRQALLAVRRRAQQSAAGYRWPAIAEHTLALYGDVLAKRGGG